MEVLQETKNDLLKRKEVKASEKYDSNPGKEKVRQEIAKQFKADEDTVVIRKIGSTFGSNTFKIQAYIYDSALDRERSEPKKKEKKK